MIRISRLIFGERMYSTNERTLDIQYKVCKFFVKYISPVLFLIFILLIISGCESYGVISVHPCESPYYYNISCSEARACIANHIREDINIKYFENFCLDNNSEIKTKASKILGAIEKADTAGEIESFKIKDGR